MKIVKLMASNVKRLRAVEITPEGALVTITGKNEAGKSSVLDSIEYALAGKGASCPQPVRRGAKKAEIVCDLGDLVVRRVFMPNGNTALQVKSKGEELTSPQHVLDELVGRLAFDPLEFSRTGARMQAEILRGLVGLDCSDLDSQHDAFYGQRTDVNRQLKAAEARLAAAPVHEGAPEREVSAAEVMQQYETATRQNAQNRDVRDHAERLRVLANGSKEHRDKLREAYDAACREFTAREDEAKKWERRAAEVKDVPVDEIQQELLGIETRNRQARENAEHARLAQERDVLARRADELTRELAAIAEDREARLRAAKFPVDGLGFSEDGLVTVDGLPFEQASQGRKLRVSVAMGLAMNPKLRVLLIRDGSLLDTEGMRLLAEMAQAADAQLWVERVEGDQAGSVLIEDGQVVSEPVEE